MSKQDVSRLLIFSISAKMAIYNIPHQVDNPSIPFCIQHQHEHCLSLNSFLMDNGANFKLVCTNLLPNHLLCLEREILTTATYPYGVSTLLQSPSLLNHIPLAQILPRQCERHNLAPIRRNLNLLKPMELSDWSTWDIKV